MFEHLIKHDVGTTRVASFRTVYQRRFSFGVISLSEHLNSKRTFHSLRTVDLSDIVPF